MEVTNFNNLDLSKLYTYADYYSWKFQERVELIRGKVFQMSPAPNRIHQKIARELTGLLFNHFKTESCELYPAPFDVRLPLKRSKESDPETVVQPDLCVVCDLSKLDDKGCNGAPDLVIEILSPGNSKKEMHEKFEVYQESGVREYWLVNPLEKAILIYVLDNEGEFIGKKPLVTNMELQSYIFPSLRFDVAAIFAS